MWCVRKGGCGWLVVNTHALHIPDDAIGVCTSHEAAKAAVRLLSS